MPRLERALARGAYNGPGVGLRRVEPSSGIAPRLRLWLSLTNYASTLLTHSTRRLVRRPSDLDRRRANLMGVSVWLLTSDGFALATRRSGSVIWSPNRLGSSASGSLDPADLSSPDPMSTAAHRELSEELDVRPDEVAELRFSGLALAPNYLPDLIGIAATRLTASDVAARRGVDAGEISELLPLRVNDLDGLLRSLRVDDWEPTPAVGLLTVLERRHGAAALWLANQRLERRAA